MKNHKEMFEALLAGETLLHYHSGFTIKLIEDELYCYSEEGLVESINVVSLRFAKEWQIKQKTININGIEVPEPSRKQLEISEIYYIPYFVNESLSISLVWHDNPADFRWFNLGFVHLVRENAELHAKALLSFTQKE